MPARRFPALFLYPQVADIDTLCPEYLRFGSIARLLYL
jgi:hypothetical protein